MEIEIDRQATVSRELWKAVRAGDFSLVFQPKVNLETDRVIGFEALIRWTSQELVDGRPFFPGRRPTAQWRFLEVRFLH